MEHKIDSKFVGVPWRQVVRTVTFRDISNFAAGIGDTNPIYYDDENGTPISHPLFTATLTWPIASKIKNYIDLPYPDEVLDRNVHYTMYVEIARPIPAGADVVIDSQIGAIMRHPKGTLIVFRYQVSGKDGALYHTEYNGCLLRDVTLDDEEKGRDAIPVPPREPSCEPVRTKRILVDKTRPYVYDGASGIIFDIHTSPSFAHGVGLPDIILQGTCTIAMAVSEVMSTHPNGAPEKVSSYGCRLTGMVFPGNELSVEVLEETEKGAAFRVVNLSTGKAALSDGIISFENQ